ncbi:MAG TPA: DUF3108 domain-containing protein [Flavobacterium sp.]|jgi:hypothetical protein|nr:DUF3108 domain-containing protein [Flavobacterium sp.]
MKKLVFFILIFFAFGFQAQNKKTFDVGEWFKFRVHYGLINAGYATLEVKEAVRNNKKVYHAVGKGYSTGIIDLFFKVEDNYESYFDKENGNPYQYVRKINEGGYIKNQEGFFNQTNNTVKVKDYKHNTEKTFSFPKNTQDIVSSFYYLRNYPTIDDLKKGQSVTINMFFDNETTKFRLKYIGKENIETKFGKISAKIFRPLVQTGRVFKENESLTLWISNDKNKIPIKIQANLVVGSLKADLIEYKGLKNTLEIIK